MTSRRHATCCPHTRRCDDQRNTEHLQLQTERADRHSPLAPSPGHKKQTIMPTYKQTANCDKRLEADNVNGRPPLSASAAGTGTVVCCMLHVPSTHVERCMLWACTAVRRCIDGMCCPRCICRAFEAEASKHVARLGKPVCPWLHDNAAMPRCNGSTCSKMGTAASGAAGALLRPDPHCTTEY
jgi:hypothetical protein